MENRERDKLSQSKTPTEAGEINRGVEEEKGRKSGNSAEFGENIGRSEELGEGGKDMKRNPNEDMSNKNLGQENESTRRSGQGEFGSSGRSGSSSNLGEQSSNIESDKSRRGSTGNENSGSSSGRH